MRILVLALLLLIGNVHAQAASITTYIGTQLPNNTSRSIQPVNVRNAINSVVNNLSTIPYTGQVSTTFDVTTTGTVSATTGRIQNLSVGSCSGCAGTIAPGGPSGSIQFNLGGLSTSGTQAFIIQNNKVSLGISNPTATLEVSGTISGTHFVGDGSGLTNIPGGVTDHIVSGTTSVYANTSTNTISFTTNGATNAYVDSAGRLISAGISTTGPISGTTGSFSSLNTGSMTASGVVSANTLDSFFLSSTAIAGATATLSGGLTTGAVAASGVVSAGTISASNYLGNGSGLTGITAAAMSWYGLTNVPTQVQSVSTGAAVTLGPVSSTGAISGVTIASTGGSTKGEFIGTSGHIYDNGDTQTFFNSAGNLVLTSNLIWSSNGLADIGSFPADAPRDVYVSRTLYVSGSEVDSGALTVGGLLTAANISASGNISAVKYIGDGSLLTNLPSGGTPQSIVSGSTRVDARSDGTISLTTGGVVTGYFDGSGRLVIPGISATTNQSSFTTIAAQSISGTGTSGVNISASYVSLNPAIITNGQVLYVSGNTIDGAAGADYDRITNRSAFDSGISGIPNLFTPSATVQVSGNVIISSNTAIGFGLLTSRTAVTSLEVSGTVSATNVTAPAATITALTVTSCSGCGSGGGTAISTTTFTAASNISGSTDIGFNAAVGTGVSNSAFGASALKSNTTGLNNTALGQAAGVSITTGTNNIAIGPSSLSSLTTGGHNIGIGSIGLNTQFSPALPVLSDVLSGSDNVALGDDAGSALGAAASQNVIIGNQAFQQNTGAAPAGDTNSWQNVVIGYAAMGAVSGSKVISGDVVIGYEAAFSDRGNRSNNVFIGRAAAGNLLNGGTSNTFVGANTGNLVNQSGNNNLLLGAGTDTFAATSSNDMDIANAIYGNTGSGMGNVNLIGINQSSPTTSLEVSGTISTTALFVNGVQITTNGGGGGGSSISTTQNQAGNVSGSIGIGFNAAVGTGISNTSVGASAGASTTTGTRNTAVGAFALALNTTGTDNTAFGNAALRAGTGSRNTVMGQNSMGNATSSPDNTAVGFGTLMVVTNATGRNVVMGGSSFAALGNGARNIGIGNNTGDTVTGASDNILIGDSVLTGINGSPGRNVIIGSLAASGASVNNGTSQTAIIGYNAFNAGTSIGESVALGANTGLIQTTGQNELYLGTNAGSVQTTGDSNIYIGHDTAGFSNSGARQVNIANSIYGDWGRGIGKNLLGINVTSPTAALEVSGSVKLDGLLSAAGTSYMCVDTSTSTTSFSNTTCTVSDLRFKTNITTFTGSLDKVMKLTIREFEFKNPAYGKGRQVGLIAQEVEPVLPQMVGHGSNGDLSVDYAKMSVLAIGAVQQQQEILDKQEDQIILLQKEVQSLKEWRHAP